MRKFLAITAFAAALAATPALARGGHGGGHHGGGGHIGGGHIGGGHIGGGRIGGGRIFGGGGFRGGHRGYYRGGGLYFAAPFAYTSPYYYDDADDYDYGYSYGRGCARLHQKALDTGSRYWWRRYRACRGY